MSPQQFTSLQHLINYQGNLIMATLADIQTQLDANSRAIDSAASALTDLKAKLDTAIAAGADPATLQAMHDQLAASTAKLEGALTANTPT